MIPPHEKWMHDLADGDDYDPSEEENHEEELEESELNG